MEKIDRNLYLTTGEFAKIAGIQRKHLIYYDTIGLFSPEKVSENGYRYYYYRQLYTLNTILTLKEIGMPLEEIRGIIYQRDPEILRPVFTQQQEKVQQQLAKLQQIHDMMQLHLENLAIIDTVSLDTYQVETLPRQYLFLADEKAWDQDPAPSLARMLTRFYLYGKEQGYERSFPRGIKTTITHQDQLAGNPILGHQKTQFYYHLMNGADYREAGTFVTKYTRMSHQERGTLFSRLLDHAKARYHEVEPVIYEDNLTSEISEQFPDGYLVRLSVRVAQPREAS